MSGAVAAEPVASASWAQRASDWLHAHPRAIAVIVAAPLLPLTLLGYGNDVDTWNVRVSARSIRAGDYVISRPPGAPVHEAATALLDPIGGSLATNLASVAMAIVAVCALASLLRRAGARHAELAALALAASPFFIVGATSLSDAVWAIALFLVGVEVLQRGHPWFAGLLWALAIGCRMDTGLLVVGYVAAELVVARARARPAITAGVVAAVLGAIAFVPAWLSVGRSADFLQNSFGSPTLTGLVGRWGLKQMLFFGLPALVVTVWGWRAAFASVRQWRRSTLVTFALIGGALQELLFLRLPWKFSHLLPVLVCVVIVYALAPKVRAEWFMAFAAAQLVWGFVAVRTVVPDVRDNASKAKVDIAIVGGPLWSDVRCRIDDPGTPAPRTDQQQYNHALDRYKCADNWAYGSDVDVPTSAASPTSP